MITKGKVIMLFAAAVLAMSSPAAHAYHKDSCPVLGKASAEKREARRMELYKELNVSDEQKRLLEENRKTHKEEAKAMFGQMKEKRVAMREELQKESLDMAKINQFNSELKELQARMLDHRLDRILEVRKILTPEQFKKFLAKTEAGKGRLKDR